MTKAISILTAILTLQFGPMLIDQYRIWQAKPQDNGMIYAAQGVPFACDYRTRGLVFIGDSVTYGVKVTEKQTYPCLVSDALGAGYENWAVPGYDALDVLASLKVNNWKSRADHIIYGYCLNDFSSYSRTFVPGVGLIRHTPRLSDWIQRIMCGGTGGILHRAFKDAPPMDMVILPFNGIWQPWIVRSYEWAKNRGAIDLSKAPKGSHLPGDPYHLSVKGHEWVAKQIIHGVFSYEKRLCAPS